MSGKYPSIKIRIMCLLSACAILGVSTSCGSKLPDKDWAACAETAAILRSSPVLIPNLALGEYPDELPPTPVIDEPADGSAVKNGVEIVFHMPEDSPGAYHVAGVDVIYGGYLITSKVGDSENAQFLYWTEPTTAQVQHQWIPTSTGIYVILVMVQWEWHSWLGTWQEGEYSDAYVCVEVTKVTPGVLQSKPPMDFQIPSSLGTTTPAVISTQTATATLIPSPTLIFTPTHTLPIPTVTFTRIPPRPTSTSTYTPEPQPVNCSAYTDQRSCEADSACKWEVPPTGGPGACKNK